MTSIKDMTLAHYSREPLVLDRDRDYPQKYPRRDKPNGLWLSVSGEDDWPSWCRAEGFCLGGLAHETIITLDPAARILLLESYDDIRGLTEQYPGASHDWSDVVYPDWGAIAGQFDGIVIAPYSWEARFDPDTFWYYSWDCASGCIWNLDVIMSVAPQISEEATA